MSIQVLIIGLGQFGMSLARTLSEKGTEVIAVDQDKELVDEAAGFLDDALCLDAKRLSENYAPRSAMLQFVQSVQENRLYLQQQF